MSEWALVYRDFDPGQEGLREALCTLGNGYFATRGAAPEAAADDYHYPGTYVAGLFNRLETEMAGRVIENEDMVNVPNWLPLRFRMDGGDWVDLRAVEVLDYEQRLELRAGVLVRSFVFVEEGRRTRVAQRRFVGMDDPHVAGLETTFLAENWSGALEVRSELDGTVTNSGVSRYRQLANQHLTLQDAGAIDDESVYLVVETNQSLVRVAEACRTRVWAEDGPGSVERRLVEEGARVGHHLALEMSEGEAVTVEKVVALYTSRDKAISDAALAARNRVVGLAGFEDLLQGHVLAWDQLWRRFCLEVEAAEEDVMILNLHVFHLLQTVSKHTIDLDVGVPARGLHGEAYRGHIFWDELFIFPFLNLHFPDITRSLLQYRFRRLPAAREAARRQGLPGALYPWQSGSDGREESQTVHLNPHSGNWPPDHSYLQHHINIAVAYNVWQYYEGTGDVEFLACCGTEMLVEIARLWAGLASYRRDLDRYEIRGVMGPDEYHDAYPDAEEPGLNNNAYTNVMVVWALQRAAEALELTPEFRRQELWEKLGLAHEELEHWSEISTKMLIPFHDGVISQFEGYADLKEFDWLGYTERYGDIMRLDRILEAEGDTPNRYKLSKQADVLMLFYLLSATELEELLTRLGYEWDPELIPRTIDYYRRRTSHGSTLSRIVHSWVLARSDREKSWEFFRQALLSDVTDIQGGTTPEGIHLGAMAGTVDLVQRGYTGLETRRDTLILDPALPDEFGKLRFDIHYRRRWVTVEVGDRRLSVTNRPGPGDPIKVGIGDDVIEVPSGVTKVVEL